MKRLFLFLNLKDKCFYLGNMIFIKQVSNMVHRDCKFKDFSFLANKFYSNEFLYFIEILVKNHFLFILMNKY